MSVPSHQRVLQLIAYGTAGLLMFGAVLDSVSNAFTLISPSLSYWGTIVLLLAWLATELFVQFASPRWSLGRNSVVRLRRLGAKPRLVLLGVLTLLLLPRTPEVYTKFVAPVPSVLPLVVRLENTSGSPIELATRGEFLLWLPQGIADFPPTVAGRFVFRFSGDTVRSGLIVVPPRSSIRVFATPLNEDRYRKLFEGGECDITLIAFGTDGRRRMMDGGVPFTRESFTSGFVSFDVTR